MTKEAVSLRGFYDGLKNIVTNDKLQKMVGLTVGLTLTEVAGRLLAEKIKDLLDSKYHQIKSVEYFKKMLKMHPQLKQYKPEELTKYWASLNHFAPDVASDPLAAGAFLTQSLKKLSGEELGGPPPDTFNTLVDIQKKFNDGQGAAKKSTNSSLGPIINATMGAIISPTDKTTFKLV